MVEGTSSAVGKAGPRPVIALGTAAWLVATVVVVAPAGLGGGDVELVGVLGLPLGLAGAGAVMVVVAVVLGPALLVGAAAALGWFSPLLG